MDRRRCDDDSVTARDEQPVWRGGARGRGMVVTAVLLVSAAVGMAPALLVNDGDSTVVVPALVVAAAAVIVLGFATVEVAIDPSGLHARTAPVPFHRLTIALADIEAARTVRHRTVSWGMSSGWGYRGSLRLFRRAAWVVRSGPALELDLRGGRRFTITLDDADEALAALDCLRTT